MKNNDQEKEGQGMGFPAPQGEFMYLDRDKLVKYFPALKMYYIVAQKMDEHYHLPVFNHSENLIILRNEVKDILSKIYPEYQELMHETFLEQAMDPEKVAFGVALGMRVYRTFEEVFIHFRGIYSNAFRNEPEFDKRYPLGDPHVPKDHNSLNFIYSAFINKERGNQYVYDGFIFSSAVLEILEFTYGIIEPCTEPQEYNGYLTDAWKLKGKL